MQIEQTKLAVVGHVLIEDNVDGVVLDKRNAIHPQNISRILARALANEANHSIYKIAFGNGGTYVDATGEITFRTPNDGQLPDTRAWNSRLYNETYSEVIDESSTKLGIGPGSFPSADGNSTGVRSVAAGVNSQVVITAVLNAFEPDSQISSSLDPTSTSTDFVFDELGLYSPGLPPSATQGYQDVGVGRKVFSDYTYLAPATSYSFTISVDGAPQQTITVSTPANAVVSWTYEILARKVNEALVAANVGAIMHVTRPGINTFGKIRLMSNTSGSASSVRIVAPNQGTAAYTTWLFANLQDVTGTSVYTGLDAAVPGLDGGVEDRPEDQSREQERLLTHLIFSPLLKSADRIWTITYTLTLSIERTLQ